MSRKFHRELVYRPLQFHERSQLFVAAHDETLSVAMRVHNPDRLPIGLATAWMRTSVDVFSLFAGLFALSLKFFHFPRAPMRQRRRIAIGFEIPQSSSKKLFPKSWREQIFLKPLDQLGNVDRLSQNWMSLNANIRSSVAQRG
jgi:hypothetical protein